MNKIILIKYNILFHEKASPHPTLTQFLIKYSFNSLGASGGAFIFTSLFPLEGERALAEERVIEKSFNSQGAPRG